MSKVAWKAERDIVSLCHALDSIDLPLGACDTAGKLLYLNAALVALLERPAGDYDESVLAELLPTQDCADFLAQYLPQAASGLALATVLRCATREIPIEISWVPTVAGMPALFSIRVLSQAHHLFTDRERALREYQVLLANAPLAIAFASNWRIVRYNREFARIFGFVGDNGLGLPVMAVFPGGQSYEEMTQKAAPFLHAAQAYSSEILLKRQDGSTFWASMVAYPVENGDKRTIWIVSDISARKLAEVQLQATLQEWEAIFANASVGIAYTKDRFFQRCNERIEAILGYDVGEMVGLPGIAIYPSQESYDRIGLEATPLLASGQAYESDWQYQRKDGSLVWCHVYAKAVDPERNERGTVWVLEDTTAARETQEKLRQTLRDNEGFLDYASVGIIFTAERKVQRSNPKFDEMFGFEPGQAVGVATRLFYRSDEEFSALGQRAGPLLSRGMPFQEELYMRRQDGSDFWVNLIGYVADPENPTRGTWWLLEDRSESKQTEEILQKNYAALKEAHDQLATAQAQLLQSEKMASIGQLAAGVAHEINNPIGFVNSNIGTLSGYIEQLLKLVEAYEHRDDPAANQAEAAVQLAAARKAADIEYLRDDIVDLLKESREGLGRVRRIVQDLRDFSHIDTGEWQPSDLNAGIQSTLNVVWNEIKYKATVNLELGELPLVFCNPAQINQVLMNLLVNAAQAIEKTGEITVRSGVAGEMAWVEVQDTGSGIPPEVQAKIFDPFFTTKPIGKGTGLGLSVSYGIVNKHGGRFEMESTPGVGTRFRFWLPVAGPEEQP